MFETVQQIDKALIEGIDFRLLEVASRFCVAHQISPVFPEGLRSFSPVLSLETSSFVPHPSGWGMKSIACRRGF
jgi:hypothetical protein